jgi:hypothetical protein
MTCDITHAMATGESHPRGDLHAGTLDCSSGVMLDESESTDVASSATMNVQSMRGNVDQPFVRALGVSSGDRIYVGVNDFNQSNGRTATIDVSVDGGATYKSVPIERRKTAGQDGPSVRPAVANDGTVYVAFFGWRKFDGKTATSDVVMVRDDAAATGANPFQAAGASGGEERFHSMVQRAGAGAGTDRLDAFDCSGREQKLGCVCRLGRQRQQG